MATTVPRITTRSRTLAEQPPNILPEDPISTTFPDNYLFHNSPQKGPTAELNDKAEIIDATAIPAPAPPQLSVTPAQSLDLQESQVMGEEEGASKVSAEVAEARQRKAQQEEAAYRAKFDNLVNAGHFPYFLSSLRWSPQSFGSRKGHRDL